MAVPVVLGLGMLLLGVVLMIVWWLTGHDEFFGRKREIVDPDVAAGPQDRRGRGAGGGGLMGAIVLGYDASPGARTALSARGARRSTATSS